MAVTFGHFARQHGTSRSVRVLYFAFDMNVFALFQCGERLFDQPAIFNIVELMLLTFAIKDRCIVLRFGFMEQSTQVQSFGFEMGNGLALIQPIGLTDHFIEMAVTELSH